MAKKARDLEVRHWHALTPQRCRCPVCGERMWLDYTNHRTLVLLDGLTRLDLAIRRCHNGACSAHLRPYRPEAEGRFALPHHENRAKGPRTYTGKGMLGKGTVLGKGTADRWHMALNVRGPFGAGSKCPRPLWGWRSSRRKAA